MPQSLTACVIALDEEERLPACLRSLAFCEEVIVVDGGSRDRTVEIAREAGARVFENPWPGFAAQRNFALDRAAGDWVLEIDADERVSDELADSIGALLAAPPVGVRMTAIPMRDLFLGRPLGPAARYPRYRHRLFRRGAFRHDEGRAVHEGLWPDGPTEPLRGELEHLLASSWTEALRDARAYARLEARQRGRANASEALAGILLRPPAKLAYRVLLYGGWRDGWRGLAKVGLECAADAVAAASRLRLSPASGDGGSAWRPPARGPVRIVGLALTTRGSERLREWLMEAEGAGADVALICGEASTCPRPRERPLERRTPGGLVRALDAEEQIRPLDAIVAAGRRERALLRCAPRSLRGRIDPLDPAVPATSAVVTVQRLTREGESE